MRQKGITVDQFEAKFTKLAKFIPKLAMDEISWVHGFEMDLRSEVRRKRYYSN